MVGAAGMSNIVSQPRASPSPSRIDRDVHLDYPPEPAQLDSFIPSSPTESYPDRDTSFTQPLSDVLKDQYTVQSEQYSADLGTYTHTFSPIALEHNFLTPEYSSENQFSDLSIDNIPQWEDSWFPAGAPGELDKAEPLPEHASDDSNHLAVNGALYDAIQIQELKGPSAPFLSPQLTNTPSPPGQHSQNRAMSPKSFPVGATPHSHPKESKTRSRSLRVNSHHTPADSGSSSLQASPSDAFISIIRRVMIGRRQKS